MKKKMISRRDVISRSATAAGAFLAAPYLGAFANTASASTLVNDVHSQLNATPVNPVLRPQSAEQLADILRSASQQGRTLSLAGKRHAMGGQQFGTDTDLIDVTSFNKIISLAKHSGIIEVESGTIWPSIIDYCWNEQKDDPSKNIFKQASAAAHRYANQDFGAALEFARELQNAEDFQDAARAGQKIGLRPGRLASTDRDYRLAFLAAERGVTVNLELADVHTWLDKGCPASPSRDRSQPRSLVPENFRMDQFQSASSGCQVCRTEPAEETIGILHRSSRPRAGLDS